MCGVIDIESINYPPLLKTIPSPPKLLYYIGSWQTGTFSNCLAVVGSRKMSPYGKKVIEHLFSTLSKSITIVSGFMYGVDAEAHNRAIEKGLKTVAVLPWGIDLDYPEDQKLLSQEILDSDGLIISEYPGAFAPRNWTFSKRNRIVAGLSKAILVIEAAKKSGSLITAHLARQYQRQVLAIPGSIFSQVSDGCLQLIKSFAKPISSGLEINDIMNVRQIPLLTSDKNSYFKNEILDVLKTGSYTIDELSVCLSMSISDLSSKITLLCLNGLVTEKEGRFYAC